MKITVIGCGRWGSFITWYLDHIGHEVTLYGRKTISTRKGICYDFSHLFAALCRSQNIPCYVVDGTKFDDANYHHTWNRIYYNGCWWNVDVTIDIVKFQKQEKLYGLLDIGDNAFVRDKVYIITRIY